MSAMHLRYQLYCQSTERKVLKKWGNWDFHHALPLPSKLL